VLTVDNEPVAFAPSKDSGLCSKTLIKVWLTVSVLFPANKAAPFAI
jgi:hypothetical protein